MPYKLMKQDGKTCVVKKTSGAVVPGGCHADEGQAKKHMAALYAAEGREKKELSDDQEEMLIKELEEKDFSPYDAWVPGGVSTFKDLYAWRETQKESEEIRSTSADFQSLVSNILWNTDITDKTASIKSLTDEFSALLKEDLSDITTPDSEDKELVLPPSLMTKINNFFSTLFKKDAKESEPNKNGLMVWKETDGSWTWMARYSNKFRDRDNPPEIISSDSHKKFVEKVDKGLVPFPELWLWHRPELRWGKAKWVGYDDEGFALAMGKVYPGCEDIAEHIAKLDPKEIRVSHGMPLHSIVRDPDDPTVIIEHVTAEISPLPSWAAANLLTSFVILNKEDTMAIPADKRKILIEDWGIPAESVDKLEMQNAQTAKEASEAGIQSKETAPQAAPIVPETTPAAVPPATSAPAPVQKEAPVETPQASTTPSAQEIADAVSTVLNERLTAIDQKFTALEAALSKTQEELKALKETDETKITKAVQETPAMSITALLANSIRSSIGASETLVDGRSALAKAKPKETEAPEASASTNIGMWVVDQIIQESEKLPQ